MVYQRCCSLPEDDQLFFNQCSVIIDALRSVPAHIIPDPAKNIVCGTIEHNERVDGCEAGHVLRLSGMARDAVQNKQFVLLERSSLQEQADDLFRQRKVLILEKQAALENSVDNVELLCRVICGVFAYGYSAAEFRSKIEVMTSSAEQPKSSDGVSQRAFANAGGAQKKDGIDREQEGHRHC